MSLTQWIILGMSLGGLLAVGVVFLMQVFRWEWPEDLAKWEALAYGHKVTVLMSKSHAVTLTKTQRAEIGGRCCLGVWCLEQVWLKTHPDFTQEQKAKLRQILTWTAVLFLDDADLQRRWAWGAPYPKAFLMQIRKKLGRAMLPGSAVRLDLLSDVTSRVHPLEHELLHLLFGEFTGSQDPHHERGDWNTLKDEVSLQYRTQLLLEKRPLDLQESREGEPHV